MEESCDGGSQWRDSEVLDLISVWGDTSIQVQLETVNADYNLSYCSFAQAGQFRIVTSSHWILILATLKKNNVKNQTKKSDLSKN